jgi:hypothetical protein
MNCKHASISIAAAVALLACDDSKDTASQQASVEASYQELAGEFASCGERLEECSEAADEDGAELRTCGVDFRACRDQAGARALKTMVGAIAACVEEARECRSRPDQDKAECRRQLWSCLGDRRHADDDDADGGVDEATPDRRSVVRDCIEQLKDSVERGEKPENCARAVRECVAEALPEPAELIPGAGEEMDGGAQVDEGAPAHGRRLQAWLSARACLGEFRSCVHERRGARQCIEALHECTHPAADE